MKRFVRFLFRFYPPVKLVCRPARDYEQVWDGTQNEFVTTFATYSNHWVAVPRQLPKWALRLNWWAHNNRP